MKFDKPACVVWSKVPYITKLSCGWGHMGISDSKGIIYDFQGDYNVCKGNLQFGEPSKYYDLKLKSEEMTRFDSAIKEAEESFKKRKRSLISNNCHNYVCDILNNIKYQDKKWTPTLLANLITSEGLNFE